MIIKTHRMQDKGKEFLKIHRISTKDQFTEAC